MSRLAEQRARDLDHLPVRERERGRQLVRVDAARCRAARTPRRRGGRARAAGSGRAALAARCARKRFSATVIHGISVSSWKTVPTPRARASCGLRKSTSSPRTRTDARVRLEHAAQDLDHRALAGAVLADERVHLAELGAERRRRAARARRRTTRDHAVPSIAGRSVLGSSSRPAREYGGAAAFAAAARRRSVLLREASPSACRGRPCRSAPPGRRSSRWPSGRSR